jgi:SAM-dependent methyltransferase
MSLNMSIEAKQTAHITVEHVLCPNCGADDYEAVASGPDYENHCGGDQEFQMVRCRGCGLYYLNPRPTLDMLGAIYPPDAYICYNFSEKGNSLVAQARQRRSINKVKPAFQHLTGDPAMFRALDIGAGDGTLLRILHDAGIPKNQLWGVDIDQKAVDGLRAQGFHGEVARAEEMVFQSGTFDLVTISHVIEHVESPRQVMQRAYEMLKPGGVFWIETPNIAGWDWRFFKERTWGGYHFPRHWTLWTPQTMSRALMDDGFEVAEVATLAGTFVWVWTVNHILQDRKASPGLTNFFSLNSFLPLVFFYLFDSLPAKMGRSSIMRIIARRPYAP